jgi:serine/threonine-protein kinase
MTLSGVALQEGRYVLGDLIGCGGMGEVYAATDVHNGHAVAVKLVRADAVDETHALRMRREALAIMRMQSAYVPELYAVDVAADGTFFLVMELLHGETLAEELARTPLLSFERLYMLVEDVLCALVDAHAAGVIHRDLKPGNVFVTHTEGRDRAKVLDFGVCKMEQSAGDALTLTGETVGTVAYMAPEQIRGTAYVGPATDLYAVGLIAFEALTGRLPHGSAGQLALLARKLEEPAPSLREVDHVAVPHGVEAFIARCLERAPERRFSSASEALAAWKRLAPGRPATAPVGGTEPTASLPRWLVPAVAAAFLVASVILLVSLRPRPRGSLALPTVGPSLPSGAMSPVEPPPRSQRQVPTPQGPTSPSPPPRVRER